LAEAGQLYRVIELDGARARVQQVGAPPSAQEWIAVDERVRLSTPFP
jgi:hypothetical protein